MKNYHYYTRDESDLKSEERTFKYVFFEREFTFTSDNGVFCKNYIDFGSEALLKHFRDTFFNDYDFFVCGEVTNKPHY